MSSRIYSRRYETAAALSRRQRLTAFQSPTTVANEPAQAPPPGRLTHWAQRMVALLF